MKKTIKADVQITTEDLDVAAQEEINHLKKELRLARKQRTELALQLKVRAYTDDQLESLGKARELARNLWQELEWHFGD